MKMSRILCPLLLITITGTAPALDITSRDAWNALPFTTSELVLNPVLFVVIHHSEVPPACYTKRECTLAMQHIQNMHLEYKGWPDISYNFAVGGDGNVYEGRGWSQVGAYTPGYDKDSIGICLIGNWTEETPPQNQLDAAQELIQYGVDQGMINPDYMVLGHREISEVECPGDGLFAEISTWENFVEF
jgi:hypothetical protein